MILNDDRLLTEQCKRPRGGEQSFLREKIGRPSGGVHPRRASSSPGFVARAGNEYFGRKSLDSLPLSGFVAEDEDTQRNPPNDRTWPGWSKTENDRKRLPVRRLCQGDSDSPLASDSRFVARASGALRKRPHRWQSGAALATLGDGL